MVDNPQTVLPPIQISSVDSPSSLLFQEEPLLFRPALTTCTYCNTHIRTNTREEDSLTAVVLSSILCISGKSSLLKISFLDSSSKFLSPCRFSGCWCCVCFPF